MGIEVGLFPIQGAFHNLGYFLQMQEYRSRLLMELAFRTRFEDIPRN